MAALKKQVSPLQEKLRVANAEASAWEEERASLKREAESWQAKVQRLFESHEQIDPEQHRQLQTEAAELRKQVEEQGKALETAHSTLAVRQREIGALKRRVETLSRASQEATAKASKSASELEASKRELADKVTEATSSDAEHTKELEVCAVLCGFRV